MLFWLYLNIQSKSIIPPSTMTSYKASRLMISSFSILKLMLYLNSSNAFTKLSKVSLKISRNKNSFRFFNKTLYLTLPTRPFGYFLHPNLSLISFFAELLSKILLGASFLKYSSNIETAIILGVSISDAYY